MLPKFYAIVGEKKFYAYENGALYKNAETGEAVEVEADKVDDLQEVEEKAVSEVAKMLGEATTKASKNADSVLAESVEKSTEAMEAFFGKVTDKAKAAVNKMNDFGNIELSFDPKAALEQAATVATKGGQNVRLSFKNAAELLYFAKTTTEEGNLTGDVIEPDRAAGISRDPQRRVFLESISNVEPTTSNVLEWVEVTGETGAPATTGEIEAAPLKDFQFGVQRTDIKDIRVANKHSKNLANDAPRLVAKIREMLLSDMALEVDRQLLKGDGTGNNLTGIMNTAESYTATEVGTKRVASANLFDVVRVIMTHIMVASDGEFVATHVLVNPDDADELDLVKDSQGRYLVPGYVSADGTRIKGALVIMNTGVTKGKVLVGDFTKHHVGSRSGYDVDITNSDQDDFLKGIITIRMERRIGNYVRTNDSAAFQEATIADIKAALEAPAA